MRPTLIVMVKDPRPGRVKTRLARDIGTIDATWWMRHQTARLLRRLRDPRWHLVLAATPDRIRHHPACWPADLPRRRQGSGDLGARMARLLRRPRGLMAIVGSDIPALGAPQVARAFRALGGHDAVFGPAPDGGYWLIGLPRGARPPSTFLTNVRWSTHHALADSIATLGPRARIALADSLADVDTAADLR